MRNLGVTKKLVFAGFMLFIGTFVLAVDASAQSGSRNFPRRSRRAPTQEETLLQQQQNLARQQAAKLANRKATLQRLASSPDGAENKRFYANAFKLAKREFMAIKAKAIPVSGRRLEQIFVLRSKDLDRAKRNIRWPKTLNEDPHSEVVEMIESGLESGELSTAQFVELLAKLSQQLERRVIDETISIKDYATAKRFVSGLANETEL